MLFYLILSVSRVVSLVPSVTEMIYALSAQDKLVGVVSPCDYPPGINVPIVGNFSIPKIERIVSLAPDIVFVAGSEQKYLWEKLKSLGLNTFVVNPQNLREIYTSIIEIGNLLDAGEKADSIVREMKDDFILLPQLNDSTLQKRKVYIEISVTPLITCGKGSFINNLITLAQGINIANEIDKEYPVISSEFVVKQDPDVIIVLHQGTLPQERLGWQSIKAVKEGRVYKDIDPNIIERPGPRVIKGIEVLKNIIYPELFTPNQKTE